MIYLSISHAKVASIEWLKRVGTEIINRSEWGTSSPVLKPLHNQIKDIEIYGNDPITVDTFIKILVDRGVGNEDIDIVKGVRPVVRKNPVRKNPISLYQDLERVSGKSIVLSGFPEEDTADIAIQNLAYSNISVLIRAIPGILKYKKVGSAWKLVRKIRLVFGKGRGTEDASFDVGQVLSIVVGKEKIDVGTIRSRLIHELGHAVEEKTGIVFTNNDSSPYGHPPFVSEYAKLNATEDFAETFRELVVAPTKLRKIAPTKYDDMLQRL